MAQEPIEIQFTLTENDMRAAAATHRAGRTRKKRSIGINVWYGMVIALALYLIIRNFDYIRDQLISAQMWEQAWLWVALGVILVGALWWQRRTAARRLLANSARLRAPRTKEITRQAIVTTIAGKADRLEWRNVPRVIAGPDVYLVYRPNGMFDVIPTRVLEAPERERFERWAGQKLIRPSA
jgi:hypothetical protein